MTGWLRVAWLVARNDLRREVRTGESLAAMVLFALIVVVVFGFLWGDLRGHGVSDVLVAGIVWVTIPFAALVGYGRSFSVEQDEDRLLGLALVPVDRSALYAGKLLGNLVLVGILEAVFLPLAAVFLGINLLPILGPLLVVLALGSLGLAAVGTLFAAIVAQLRKGEAFLAILLFPVVMPVVVCAVQSTAILLAGDPLSEARTYLLLMLVFDLVFLALGAMVFDALMEE
jgi:heme exporter protein B